MNEQSIFTEALELQADQRGDYLAGACGADEALRRRIESLLHCHAQAVDELQPPLELLGLAFEQPIAEGPSTAIGPYKLLEQIGEGGFGVVFLAEQEKPVRRRVALKVIKPGMDTREVIARFEAERQALAMMDHPNIAKVHDAGATENGRPYFVMELVQGVPITEYCDQCNLTTNERLELFVTVCQAVQHAHQKGVIHRDIKPTNVLVAIQDGQPAPKIIDFGVAKAIDQQLTERTLVTAFAQMVGTPLYMSPEQAELSPLGVDTRSDIYSLGVLLYELLSGTTPFDKERLYAASYDELRRIVREEEPPRPSARISTLAIKLATTIAERRRTDAWRLRQTIRGELDWIVMKCLEKDRNRRYETPNSLARDIEHYLHDEPVQACPPSVAYRVSKFIRRNKVAALASAAILVSLTIATGLSTSLYLREREAHRQAEFGAKISDVANHYHNNDAEAAEESLTSLMPLMTQMDSKNKARLYYTMGDVRARHGMWKESATYFAEGLELEPNRLFFEPWLDYLPVLVRSGDLEGYKRARQEVFQRFGKTTDPRIAEYVLKDCLFIPWPDANFVDLEQLADAALHSEYPWALDYFQNVKALLEYRRGNYKLALTHSRGALASVGNPYLFVHDAMVRAMAYHQLGKTEDARRVLSIGLEYDARLPRENELFIERRWNDWILAHALVKEATSLIDPTATAEVPKLIAKSQDHVAAVGNLYLLALEKLRSEDVSGYQEACAAPALVPENSEIVESEMRRTWTWCLGPNPLEALRMPLKHAERAVANNAFDANYFELLVLGGMLYRMGQYETAAKHLEASMAAYPLVPPAGFGNIAYPQLLLSMAKWQLGEKEQARRLLAEIRPAIDEVIQTPSLPWKNRATLEVLRRETEALIGQKEATAAPDNDTTTIVPLNPEP